MTRLKKITLAFVFGLGLWGTVQLHQRLAVWTAPPPLPADPRRIISLAPSLTETLFAVGLGDRVAGVTQYCHYPPAAAALPKVAGFSDLNLEAILRQNPDLAVLPPDKPASRAALESLGLPVLTLDTRTLSGFRAATERLGKIFGREAQAEEIDGRLEAAIDRARARADSSRAGGPRVLFSIMHAYEGLGYITEINAVGQDGFFSELLEIAGGRNAYQGPLAFPRLSREALLQLNPEVIIDVVWNAEDMEALRRDWLSLDSTAAIRNGRLVFFNDEADTVPGPRSHLTLDKLSQALYP